MSAQSYMKAGKLVPDDVVLALLKNEVEQHAEGKSVLLDGFPRTTHQASKLGDFFKIDAVISLDIPHQVIIDRLSQRWIHQASSRTYSYDYNPPKVKGIRYYTLGWIIYYDPILNYCVVHKLDQLWTFVYSSSI